MDNEFNFEGNVEIQGTANWKPKYYASLSVFTCQC